MAMQKVIELANPEQWANEVFQLLEQEKIKLPSDRELEKWTWTDQTDNKISNKVVNAFSKFCIRAYHACRPINVENYYKFGLKVPDDKTYYDMYNECIKHLNLKLTDEQYKAGRDKLEASELDKNIYFCLLPDDLLDKAGHYLIYGSEKIFSALAKAVNSYAIYSILEDAVGTATMIEVNVPINILSKYCQKVVSSEILQCLKDYSKQVTFKTESCIWLNKNIEAKYVASHTNPTEAFNVHKWSVTKFKSRQIVK